MDGGLVRVWAGGDRFEGQILRGRLEAEGIPVLAKGESEGPYVTGPVYLFVPEEHEEAALRVVHAARSGELALDEEAAERDEGRTIGEGGG